MGSTTAWGIVPRLVSIVGAGVAARLLFTGEEMTAKDAQSCGLVDDVTPDGGAMGWALARAEEIARGSPIAIARMKQLLREVAFGGAQHASEVRDLERRLFIQTWTSPDHGEAMDAYFERRPPRWLPHS
jgi:enoyl-CoA hydratase/carnithine racemase